MSLRAISSAVEARLAALWTKCPVEPFNSLKGDTDGTGAPYLTIQFPASTSEQISMGAPGANVWRTEGAFLLILNGPRGDGLDEALAWVDELAAIFRGQVFDGLRCFAPSQPVLDDRNDDGIWFSLSFGVPYEFDFFA